MQVQLQVVAMDDLFTMCPLTEYDLFTMARSNYSNRKVGSCQTNDDAKEEECQTDVVGQGGGTDVVGQGGEPTLWVRGGTDVVGQGGGPT